MTLLQSIERFDEAKAGAFAERFVSTLTEASLAIMTSLGHRAGLFDVMAELPRATCAELAEASGCRERYLREWLGVMATSAVVDYDPVTRRYTLPVEHAACLTRAARPDNLAVTSQFIVVSASVEDEMLERFRSGGGLQYDHFERFHEVMAEDSDQLVVGNLENAILPVVPGLVERLENGIEVADVGCGAGLAMLTLAKRFPASRFHGFDLCAEAFAGTESEVQREDITNLRFTAIDLSEVERIGAFDLITAFDAVHDQKDPPEFLRMIRASLYDDGVYLMQDIGGSRDLEKNLSNPFAPLLYTLSTMHCTPISIGQGGPGLGAMWGVETAEEYLRQADFVTETQRLPHDPINAYYVARPAPIAEKVAK